MKKHPKTGCFSDWSGWQKRECPGSKESLHTCFPFLRVHVSVRFSLNFWGVSPVNFLKLVMK